VSPGRDAGKPAGQNPPSPRKFGEYWTILDIGQTRFIRQRTISSTDGTDRHSPGMQPV